MKFSNFEAVGLALYGDRWRASIARDVGVTYQAVAHWAAAGVVPDRVVASLRTVVRERLLRLRALVACCGPSGDV